MLSFLATHPVRTRNAHNNPVFFDDGKSSIEFESPDSRYLVINRLPPAAADAEADASNAPSKPNCALNPPLHWHYYQLETFHVLKGTAKFFLNGQARLAETDDVVTIPAQALHTFRNASTEEELEIEFVLDPGTREIDEAFFSAYRLQIFNLAQAE